MTVPGPSRSGAAGVVERRPGAELGGGRLEEAAGVVVAAEQRVDLRPQRRRRRRRPASRYAGALGRVADLDGGVEDRVGVGGRRSAMTLVPWRDAAWRVPSMPSVREPAGGAATECRNQIRAAAARPAPTCSCWYSQARAYAQWRSAVAAEMPRAVGGLLGGQPGEVAELDQPRPSRLVAAELGQGLVEGEQVRRAGPSSRPRGSSRRSRSIRPRGRRRAWRLACAARLLDQDAAHRLGRGGEEVAAAVPAAAAVDVDEPQVRLVDQGRGLERLPRLLARQPLGGQLPQLVVDQRQQLAPPRRGRPARRR